MSEPYDSLAQIVDEATNSLSTLYQEVLGFNLNLGTLSFDRAGAERVVHVQQVAFAYAERASVIQATAGLVLARAARALSEAEAAYQAEYDTVVEAGPRHANWAARSWEERASTYRLRTFGSLRTLNTIRQGVEVASALRDAVKVRADRVRDARWGLSQIVEGYDLAIRLRELPTE